jgi:hypothetical protein
MANAQERATKAYRARLDDEGLGRFEMIAPKEDQELLRGLARLMSRDEAKRQMFRRWAAETLGLVQNGRKGGVVAALRKSPLVGVDLDVSRSTDDARDVPL